ncbi:hypothetical protein ACIGW8_39215 [Streptomyces sioyaensis]|uniref:hypothetical protein n=1 Tax=Streptomyces sioyaensis TaxID=67364 RepID=UPI0037CFADED
MRRIATVTLGAAALLGVVSTPANAAPPISSGPSGQLDVVGNGFDTGVTDMLPGLKQTEKELWNPLDQTYKELVGDPDNPALVAAFAAKQKAYANFLEAANSFAKTIKDI